MKERRENRQGRQGGTWDLGLGTWDLGLGTWDLGLGAWGSGSSSRQLARPVLSFGEGTPRLALMSYGEGTRKTLATNPPAPQESLWDWRTNWHESGQRERPTVSLCRGVARYAPSGAAPPPPRRKRGWRDSIQYPVSIIHYHFSSTPAFCGAKAS